MRVKVSYIFCEVFFGNLNIRLALLIMGKKQSKLEPQVLDDLLRRTNFDEKELKSWYRGFLKDCPGGFLTKEQFIEMYKKVFQKGDASKLATCVFRRFDVNKDGKIGEGNYFMISWRFL